MLSALACRSSAVDAFGMHCGYMSKADVYTVESCAMMHDITAAAEGGNAITGMTSQQLLKVVMPSQCTKWCSPEGINDNFALDALDWVYDYCHSSWVQLLKALYMHAYF